MEQVIAVIKKTEGNAMIKSIRKAINKFISKLAQESEKSFGNEKLDCCTLDRPKNTKK